MRVTRHPVLWLFAGRVGGTVATMAIPMVLARVMAPDDFGSYRQVFLLFATLYAIAQAGMAECLYYFMPREQERAGRLVANSLLALAAVGGVTALVLVIAARPVAALLGSPIDAFVPALAAFLALMLTSAVLEVTLVSEQRHRAAAAAYVTSDVARAACLLVPVLLIGGLGALLAGAVVFAALRLAVTLVVLARRHGRALRPERRLLRVQLGYALPFAAAVVVDTLQGQLHLYAISNQFAAATFAVYSVACFQVPLVDYLVTSVGNVLMVQLAPGGADGSSPIELWRQATGRLALVLVPLVAWLVVAGRDVIVLLFSTRYASAGGLFVLVSTGILLSVAPTDAALRAFAETRFLLAMNLIRLALVAATLPILLAWLGLAGGVLSTLVAGVVAKALAVLRVRRRLAVPLSALVPGRVLGAVVIASVAGAGAAFGALVTVRAAAPAVRLLVGGSVFVFVFALAAAGFGILPGRRIRHALQRSLAPCVALPES